MVSLVITSNHNCLQIIIRANENGEEPLELSNRFCEEYLVDMGALQCLLPTHQPRVSDHMDHIIDMIQKVCFWFDNKAHI